MGQEILTPSQKKVLALVRDSEPITSQFYLTGDTALAEFYLRHRYSDDLDFFTETKEFPQIAVEAFIESIGRMLDAAKIEYRRLYDRRIFSCGFCNRRKS